MQEENLEIEENLPSSSEEQENEENEKIKKKFDTTMKNPISNEELKELLKPNEMEALDKFKEENKDLIENKNDVFIMLFLWARKLDLARAKELLTNHYKWREKYDIDKINSGIFFFSFFLIFQFFFNFSIFLRLD
jgi:HD-GYP domain-containing protein (c-di-GMP phosphodiesterase class II)